MASTNNNVHPNESIDHELKAWEAPRAQGLYDPQNEHEACGVGFIVAIDGTRSHKVSQSINLYASHFLSQLVKGLEPFKKKKRFHRKLTRKRNKVYSCRLFHFSAKFEEENVNNMEQTFAISLQE